MTCGRCGLERCACKSGETVITAVGATPEDAGVLAGAFLARRGYESPTLLAVRRRKAKVGILGYVAWDLRYRVGPRAS